MDGNVRNVGVPDTERQYQIGEDGAGSGVPNASSIVSTPTPPSLTSESSPASSHKGQDDFTHTYESQREYSVDPSDDGFLSDWRAMGVDGSAHEVHRIGFHHEDDDGAMNRVFGAQDVRNDANDHTWLQHIPGASPSPSSTKIPEHMLLLSGMGGGGNGEATTSNEHFVSDDATPSSISGRDEGMFDSLIDHGHCAPPTAFQQHGAPAPHAINSAFFQDGLANMSAQGALPHFIDTSKLRGMTQGSSQPANPHGLAAPLPMPTGVPLTSDVDLELTANSVVHPRQDQLPDDMELHVHGVPATGAKSRVETQIRMRVELVSRSVRKGASGAPAWERIGSFRYLQVPPLSGTKRKSKKHQKPDVAREDVLQLEAVVVNATPPHARVFVCDNCRERERKRAHRKKSKKLQGTAKPTEEEIRSLGLDPAAPDAVETAMARLDEEERKHAVLFNCGDYVDFHNGEAVLSTRITCYCRHHREKVGFCIVFTLRNHRGEFIATGTTPPIMIMDDHKSVAQTGGSVKLAENRLKQVDEPTGNAACNRRRERGKPYDDLLSGRRTRSRDSVPVMHTQHDMASLPGPFAAGNVMSPRATLSPPDMSMSGYDTSMASVPRPVLPQTQETMQSPPWAEATPSQTHSVPVITKVVPAEGPTTGGSEITVLGEHFTEDMYAVFGDTPSTWTRVWASNTMVCLLPPCARPGPVVVTLRNSLSQVISAPENAPLQLFTYVDATDRALMELALQVVGLQMTGQMASARDVAMRIVGSQGGAGPTADGAVGGSGANGGTTVSGGTTASGSASGGSIFASLSDFVSSGMRLRAQHGSTPSVQDAIIGFLTLLDVELKDEELPQGCKQRTDAVCASNQRGHTLLHLAVILGFHRLTEDLLARGCPVNARDTNGYTALHFAAMNGGVTVSRCLLRHGASPLLRTNDGLLPVDVARRAEQIDTEKLMGTAVQEVLARAPLEAGPAARAGAESPVSDQSLETLRPDETDGSTHYDGYDEPLSTSDSSTSEETESESDSASEDISFAELAELQRQASPSSSTSSSPRMSYARRQWSRLGLLGPWTRHALQDLAQPEQARQDDLSDDDSRLSRTWRNLLSGGSPPLRSSPPQLASPPPTYDEATLDQNTHHIDGEKLISRLDQREAAGGLEFAVPEATSTRAKQSSVRSRARRRSTHPRGSEMVRDNNVAELDHAMTEGPLIRARPGVREDFMLIWFWIPASVLVLLTTALISIGHPLMQPETLSELGTYIKSRIW